MTTERIRAQQAQQRRIPPVQMLFVTIASANPLTVTLPGGAVVPGRKVQGYTYTAGAAAVVLYQEPAVGPVFPLV